MAAEKPLSHVRQWRVFWKLYVEEIYGLCWGTQNYSHLLLLILFNLSHNFRGCPSGMRPYFDISNLFVDEPETSRRNYLKNNNKFHLNPIWGIINGERGKTLNRFLQCFIIFAFMFNMNGRPTTDGLPFEGYLLDGLLLCIIILLDRLRHGHESRLRIMWNCYR